MKILLITFFCFISLAGFSQENTTLLTVSGKARLLATPDLAVVKVVLTSMDKDYSSCINTLRRKSDDFKIFLKNLKVNSSFVKSENFNVERQYDHLKNAKTFLGYQSRLSIRLEFLNDIDMANKIINSLSLSNSDADVSVDFEMSISKQDSIQNKLIEFAINDARKKAEIIAKSTNQNILKIDKINYGVRESYNIEENETLYCMVESEAPLKTFTITPQQIEKSTQIVIVYQLKK